MSAEQLKELAARAAVASIDEGMRVGLGTGSTASHAVRALGERVAAGLKIVGVPTSEATAELARSLACRWRNSMRSKRLDLTIDGADEVDLGSFAVIKGFGGALLREKLVALATTRVIIIVDESKVAARRPDEAGAGGGGAVRGAAYGAGARTARGDADACGCAMARRSSPMVAT